MRFSAVDDSTMTICVRPPGHFEHGSRAGIWIDGAGRPRIAMVANHKHLIGCARDGRNHVVDGLQSLVHVHLHVDCRAAGTNVVRKGQAALPLIRHARSAKISQQFLGFAIRDGQRRNLRNVVHLIACDALRAVGRRNAAWRGRVAWLDRKVLHGTALNRRRRTHRSIRIDIPPHVAVICGIGVDQHADGTALLSFFDLQPAKRTAVANQRDLPLKRQAHGFQALVVGRRTVVDVDDLPARCTGSAVAMEGRELATRCRVFVLRIRIFHQRQLLPRRLGHRQRHVSRVVEKYVVLDHFDGEAELRHAVPHVVSHLLLLGRARHVRLFGERLQPLARVRGRRRVEHDALVLRQRVSGSLRKADRGFRDILRGHRGREA